MRILFNDVIQYSDAPDAVKSPALSHASAVPAVITLDRPRPVNAIGIGNTDGAYFAIAFDDDDGTVFNLPFTDNGLYIMPKTITASAIAIATDAAFAGRIAAGLGVEICTSIPKEPGWRSTSEPRVTLSGQVVPGRGGYNYRTLSLDSRYGIGPEAVAELTAGWKYTGMGYPFFISLETESYKLPYSRLYAEENSQRSMGFEGGIRKYRYSRKWDFTERF
jgi:hypothetical protein